MYNALEKLRRLIKHLKQQRNRLESLQDAVDNLEDEMNNDSANDTVHVFINLQSDHSKELQKIRDLIDDTKQEQSNLSSMIQSLIDELESHNQEAMDKVTSTDIQACTSSQEVNLDRVIETEEKLIDLKKRWRLMIQKSGPTSQKDQIQRFIDQILGEISDISKELVNINEQFENMNGILEVILKDEQVLQDYELEKDIYQKQQVATDQVIKQYEQEQKQHAIILTEFNLIKEKYEKFTEEEAQDPHYLEQIYQDLSKIINQHSTLKKALIFLNQSLSEQRKQLQDCHIDPHYNLKISLLDNLNESLRKLQDTINALHQTLDLKIISAKDDDELYEIQNQQALLQQISQDIVKPTHGGKKLFHQFESITTLVEDQQEQLSTCPLKELIPIVTQIAYITLEIQKLDLKSYKIEEQLTDLSNQIGDVDFDSKIKQQQSRLNELTSSIAESVIELDDMSNFCKELVDIASDDDEVQTVKNLTEQVQLQRQRLEDTLSSNDNTKPLLEFAVEYQVSLKDQQSTLEQKTQLSQNISIIDNQLEKNGKEYQKIHQMEKQCGKKYYDFNLQKKYKSRQEEIKEFQELLPKVEGKMSKVSKLISDKEQMSLSDQNKKVIEQLRENIDKIELLTFLSQEQYQLEANLAKIGKEIEEEEYPGFRDYMKLIKDQRQVKDRIVKNMKLLRDMKKGLKQIKKHVLEVEGDLILESPDSTKKETDDNEEEKTEQADNINLDVDEEEKEQEAQNKKGNFYKAIKGDEVDQLLAEFLAERDDVELKIIRIEPNKYMFGTKKIYAKVMNGKLFVRVGGGYQSMEEFITYYGEAERHKLVMQERKSRNSIVQVDSRGSVTSGPFRRLSSRQEEGIDVTDQYLEPGRNSIVKKSRKTMLSPKRQLSSPGQESGRQSPNTTNKETSDTITNEEGKL